MALKDLITDLSNFKYTDYGSAGSIESQVGGRHGTVDAPIDNSDFDNGVGFGVDPNSTPQSFNVRGYTITGDKRFIVNYGGDIVGSEGSIYGMGDFNSILTPFDHTQMRDTSRIVYNQYSSVPFGDSRHTSDGDVIGAIGGGVSYYGNLLPITPRASLFRDDSGNYQTPQEFGNTNPPGTASGIVGFDGTQTTLNIPQIVLTGPFEDSYQSQLNTQPISPNAHGSDFFTSPLVNYTSQFSLDNLNTDIESGFDRGLMYISNIDEPSTPIFKQFTRGESSLTRINLGELGESSPNFDPFEFGAGAPYVIPQHNSTGPEEFQISPFSDTPLISDLHNSDFMTRPSFTSQIGTNTDTHNVSMINLTGPTTETYQSTLTDGTYGGNVDSPIAVGAHGSDFNTTPIQAYSSIFSNAAGTFGLLSDIDSGFSLDKFYAGESSRGPTSFGDFKVFTKSENSLKRISLDSPNTDPDGNEFYTFPDRLPYNLNDDSEYHSRPPFVRKDIGDKWGPDTESTFDEGLARGGFVTSIARGLADGVRISKFLLTGKGLLFAAKQVGLQLLNPRPETRTWNPASIASGNTTALGVPLRLDRHAGGGNYLDSIGGSDGDDSILTGYGNAISGNQSLAGGKIVFQTARRVTLAHISALVPGAGGKVSFLAQPEISFDLLAGGSGNITSLSPNTFSDTNDIGFNIPDRNIYGRDKKYHINTGPSSIETLAQLNSSTPGNSLVKRVTGADIGSIEDSTGSPLLDEVRKNVGTLYEGLDGLYPPTKQVKDEPKPHGAGGLTGLTRRAGGYSITLGNSNAQDSVNGIPAGNLYDEGDETFPYQEKHNKRSIIPIGLTANGLGFGPKSGLSALAEKGSIFETYEGTGKAFEFEDKPESQLAVRQVGIFDGEMFDDPNSPYDGTTNFIAAPNEPPKAFMIRSYQNSNSTFNPLIPADERSTFQAGLASTIKYEPLSEEYPAQLSLRNRTGEFLGDKYSKDEPYADKPSIFIGDKTMLVMGDGRSIADSVVQLGNPTSDLLSNVVSVEKRNTFTHTLFTGKVSIDGKNSLLPYNDDLLYGNYTSLEGGQYETNPERFQDINADETLIKQQGVKGSIGLNRRTLFGGDVNNSGGKPEEKEIFTISDADTNQYSKTKKYEQRIEVDGKNNFKSIFFGDDRLKGDPKVDFKTQYVDKDKFQRGGADVSSEPFQKTAKLQDFPRLNEEDSGGNYGNEGQALGFLKGGGRTDEHSQDGLYGTGDGRLAFGESRYGKLVKSTDESSPKFPQKNITEPTDNKKLTYQHNVEEVQEGVIGDNPTTVNFPANEKVGDGIPDKYRVLAYGQIPKSRDITDTNNYSKRVEDGKFAQKDGLPDTSKPQPVPSQLPIEGTTYRQEVGLIKINSDKGRVTDKFDVLNMIEYGEDYKGNDDYIKFKFYDTINKKHIIFPATLSGISDSITPEWNSERYIGRPDNVHVYTGTVRELSFSFKIGIMSKQQLLVCWEKLNYLIGLTYPTWKKVGNSARMEAPFMELTIGDMFNRTPGFINSLSYSIEDTTPWDIDKGTQLPKAIDVEVTFTHIGKHKLASQGKHFDLPWLRPLDSSTPNTDVENSVYGLGERKGVFNTSGFSTQQESSNGVAAE